MRVCVCTVARHPEDARILHRQIRALLDAGHRVTYVAPFRAFNVTPWRGIRPVDVPAWGRLDVPRAAGRRRLRALRAAHRALAEHAPHMDVILLPEPGLLGSLPRAVRGRTVVWDVRGPVRRRVAARGEQAWRLILADERYRAWFRDDHPVIPDTAVVGDPPQGPPDGRRVVHVGHLSVAGGALDVIELARRLRPEGVAVELIGGADLEVRPPLREAQRAGVLRWYGFVPNDRALRIAEGALAGLALPAADTGRSVPTRVVEYMGRGLPVIATPDPAAETLVRGGGCGLLVPFGDPDAAAAAVRRLREDAALRAGMGKSGYETASGRFDWAADAERFVAHLEKWAAAAAGGQAELRAAERA